MKFPLAVVAVCLIGGCASYSNHGTGEGGREVGSKGYTVRCDASPPNQPGCYSPPPSRSWSFFDKFKFGIGAQ